MVEMKIVDFHIKQDNDNVDAREKARSEWMYNRQQIGISQEKSSH
jgi:hypothetical protein